MEFIINLTIKSTLIILLSFLLLRTLKNNAAALRHWVISLTMIGLLGLPLFIGLLPTMQVEVPFLKKQTSSIKESATVPPKVTALEALPKVINETKNSQTIVQNNNVLPEHVAHFDSKNLPEKSSIEPIPLGTMLWLIWLLGACFFLIKFLSGLFSIRSITRNSVPFSIPPSVQEAAIQITAQPVQFSVNSVINSPMTWGTFRPVVLLPTAAHEWTMSELKAVVVHELSHIKRGDYWIHTIGLLSVCFYWYNPLIWRMKKIQLLEREKACDEAVLRSGIQQQNYADQLIQITRCLSQPSSIINENALPMAKVSQLKKRIIAILNFEENAYRFTKYKQWQWGLLYGGLFPILAAFSPVGQRVIQEHFPLAKLETITHLLDTKKDQLATIMPTDTLKIKESTSTTIFPLTDDFYPTQVTLNKQENNSEILQTQLLESLPISLTRTIRDPEIKPTIPAFKTGLIGQWTEGKSVFKIWTYGTIKPIKTAPYFDIISPDGLIFIKEYIDGVLSGKVHYLTIAKAQQDVVHSPFPGEGLKISEENFIKKGELIKIFSNNKKNLFFTMKMDDWIADKVQNISLSFEDKRRQNLIQETTATDQDWINKVNQTKEFIDFVYWPKEKAIEQLYNKQKREKLDLNTIPFREITAPSATSTLSILGRTKPVGKRSGSYGTNPIGNKYTTLIEGSGEAIVLKDFNFHLSKNTFKDLECELYLYNVKEGNIQHSILKQPIPIKVAKGGGWIRKDLSAYNIVSQGDVLVVLKSTDFSGSKRGKSLYLSIADDYEQYEPIIGRKMSWEKKFWKSDFWEMAFVMYLTAKGAPTAISSNIQTKVLPSEIPYKEILLTKLKGSSKKIGRTKATGTMTGLSGYEDVRGYKFGTILKNNNQKSTLQTLHFNIQKHKFESLELDLYFFKVDNNEIQHALTKEPVRISINKGEKGWIKRNLADHQIGVQGDVLVVMDIADYTARQTSLFFALSPTHILYKPMDLYYEGKQLEFWNAAFAWYATVK